MVRASKKLVDCNTTSGTIQICSWIPVGMARELDTFCIKEYSSYSNYVKTLIIRDLLGRKGITDEKVISSIIELWKQ